MTVETNACEDYEIKIIYVFNKSQGDMAKGIGSESKIQMVVDKKYLCPEELYLMRKKYFATPEKKRENLVLDDISKYVKINLSLFLNMIMDAEDQSMLYRLADYIEIKKIDN